MTTTPTFWGTEVTFYSLDINAFNPQVATFADGTFAIAWENGTDLFGRRFSELGSFLPGGDFLSGMSADPKPLFGPQIFQQADGRVVVNYGQQFDDSPLDNNVRWVSAIPSSSSFATENSPFDERLLDSTARTDSPASFGSAIVYQYTGPGDAKNLVLRFVDAVGNQASNQIFVGPHPGETQNTPALAGLLSGYVVVAYQNTNTTTAAFDIRLHIYRPNEADVAGEVIVSLPGAANPDVASLSNGNFVVTWQQADVIAFRRYRGDGDPLDAAPVPVANSSPGLLPKITALNDGGFIIAWTASVGTESDGSPETDVVMQRFSASGAAIGTRLDIDEPGDQGMFTMTIATLADGRVILTYISETGDSTNITTLNYRIVDPRETTINGTDGPDNYVGREEASTINGLLGNDKLTGRNGNDILNGGVGADELTGGLGADQFAFAALSHGGDRIEDFSVQQGDRIALQRAGFGLAATGTLQSAGVDFVHGAVARTAAPTILAGSAVYYDPDGTGVNPAVLLADIGTTVWDLAATADFNGDGTADLLWRNVNTGQTIEWLMSGSGGVGLQAALPSTNGYELAATGDFDGNGTTDFIWKHIATGQTVEWLSSAAGGIGFQAVLPNTNGYVVAGAGHFDAGPTTDLIWKNVATGATVEWLFSTTGGVGFQASLSSTAGYDVVAVGDFDANGTDDFILKHAATGNLIEWLFATTSGVGFQTTLPNVTGYSLLATGDFNNDGATDLLWKNIATGQTIEWLMSGSGGIGIQATLPSTIGYDLVATGDFNADGTDDFIWKHNASGQTIEWLSANGGGVGLQAALLSTSGYALVATGDFNDDGATDLIWKGAATGQTIEWLMSGAGGIGVQAALPSTNGWSLLTAGDFDNNGTTDIIWENAASGATNEWLFGPGAGNVIANPTLFGTGGSNSVHLTQEDFVVV